MGVTAISGDDIMAGYNISQEDEEGFFLSVED